MDMLLKKAAVTRNESGVRHYAEEMYSCYTKALSIQSNKNS